MTPPPPKQARVLVLRGGPDREREVSMQSGKQVAAALREAGHRVVESDVGPDALSVLDAGDIDVVFPVLHGPWGEGGPMQDAIQQRGLRFVGSAAPAARLCMDKHATKRVLQDHSLPTPPWQHWAPGEAVSVELPAVVKPVSEGSSLNLRLCDTPDQLQAALSELQSSYDRLLVERRILGRELTVGVLEGEDGDPTALPVIEIVPDAGFYDYHAKYEAESTGYRVGDACDLPVDAKQVLQDLAVRAHRLLGCRHLSRVDFLWDDNGPWLLEVNTMPGFTTHSLVPMAARHTGLDMPALTDRLVQLAWRD